MTETAESQPGADFLQRLQAGDELAFRELLARWQRPLLSFVYRMTGDTGAADEIVQEVFVRVFRKVGEYRQRPGGNAAFSTWLFQIARHAALDHLRHRERHPTESLEALGAAAGELAGSQPSPAAAAGLADTGAQIARAIAVLPEEQRSAIVLAEYEGLSVAEIAGVMESSEKSVESRLYRARQTLRQQLAHLL